LKYNLGHLESLEPDYRTLDHAFDLITSSANFFADEDQREERLKVTLGGLLPGKCVWREKTSSQTAKPAGVWLQGPFTYILAELKNEPGLGGDPFLRSLVAYGKFTAEDEVLFGPN